MDGPVGRHPLFEVQKGVPRSRPTQASPPREIPLLYPWVQRTPSSSNFLDGCKIRMSRPDGQDWRQFAMFSGDKWMHAAAAMGVFGPDGVCYHWFDDAVTRHTDQYFLRESGLNDLLENCQGNIHDNEKIWVYCDKGYTLDEFIRFVLTDIHSFHTYL